MKKNISSEIIEKYLNGTCTAEEEQLLCEWYSSFDDEEDPMAGLTERQKEQLKNRMFSKISSKLGFTKGPTSLVKRIIPGRLMYAVAAVAASLIIVLSLFLNQNETKPIETDFVRVINKSTKIQMHNFPDGSVAWIRPHTTISYKKTFKGPLREVTIKGEAFFYVEKNPNKPFVVHAEEIDVKVLGTSFNVKTGKASERSEVSVLTGKVYVSDAKGQGGEKEGVYLLPKEKAIYKARDKSISRARVEKQALDMWKKNSLAFDNIPVEKVVQTLNSTFAVDIKIADQDINKYTLKADFTGVNLPAILEMLGKSLDITYQVEDEKILLKKSQN